MNSVRRDEILQEMLVHDGRDMVKFRKLSEADKNAFSKEAVESMFAQLTNKYNHTDFDVIEHSKGNIEHIRGYENIEGSIQALKELKARTNVPMKELDIVEQALKNIKDYTKQWEMGFKLDKGLVIMMYNSMVSATICSLTYLIATSLDYIKDLSGSFEVKLKEQNDKNFSYPTVFIKNLENFNKVALSGELAKFFEITFSKQGFAISSTAIVLSGIGVVATLGVALAIVPIIREIIYQFYFMRVSIAEHLRVQASYLEMNQSRLNTMKGVKNTAKKQEKIANDLIKLSDKIDVDQKMASKKAEMEIKRDDSKVNNIDSVAMDSSVSSSYGGIL